MQRTAKSLLPSTRGTKVEHLGTEPACPALAVVSAAAEPPVANKPYSEDWRCSVAARQRRQVCVSRLAQRFWAEPLKT
jgi:hypothetical protein